MPNNCGHCGHQVAAAEMGPPKPGLDGVVENLLRHFDYPTKKDDSWGLKVTSSTGAKLILRSPKGTPMLILTLQFIDEAKSKKKRLKTGWMLWDMASVYPDNLERIRKSIA